MKTPKIHHEMGIIAQDNGYKTSKYVSNFKSPIITHEINGCYGQPMVTKDKHWCTLKVVRLSLPIVGIRSQNISQTWISPLSPTKSMVARGNQW